MKPGRHLVLSGLLVVAFGAFAAAKAASSAVEAALLRETRSPAPLEPAPPPPPPRRGCPPLDSARLARVFALPLSPRPAPPAKAARSRLRARLLGTLLAADPAWSLAAVAELDSGHTRTLGVGAVLLGATVVEIGRDRLILLREGHLERVDFAIPTEAPPPASAPRSELELPRAEVDRILANLNDLAMDGRIVPSFRNGVAEGFKVFAIRPGSLYSRIGVQNGDVIRRINGFELTSPQAALEAYVRLREASQVEVELGRAGATVRYTYRIL